MGLGVQGLLGLQVHETFSVIDLDELCRFHFKQYSCNSFEFMHSDVQLTGIADPFVQIQMFELHAPTEMFVSCRCSKDSAKWINEIVFTGESASLVEEGEIEIVAVVGANAVWTRELGSQELEGISNQTHLRIWLNNVWVVGFLLGGVSISSVEKSFIQPAPRFWDHGKPNCNNGVNLIIGKATWLMEHFDVKANDVGVDSRCWVGSEVEVGWEGGVVLVRVPGQQFLNLSKEVWVGLCWGSCSGGGVTLVWMKFQCRVLFVYNNLQTQTRATITSSIGLLLRLGLGWDGGVWSRWVEFEFF